MRNPALYDTRGDYRKYTLFINERNANLFINLYHNLCTITIYFFILFKSKKKKKQKGINNLRINFFVILDIRPKCN